MRWILRVPAAILLLASVSSSTIAAPPGAWHGGDVTAGGRTLPYHLWVPDGVGVASPAPLLVVLHGCTQDGLEASQTTNLNAVAGEQGFLVAYPDQDPAENELRCWNWWRPAHQLRGAGEPLLVSLVAADVASEWTVDPDRTYLAGVSSGAGMATILGATYPDVFGAIGVVAGAEYAAANDLVSALKAQQLGGPDPDVQGTLAHQSAGVAARPVRVIVFHGGLDWVVRPVNADQVVAQFSQTNDWADDGADDDSVDAAPEAVTQGQVPDGHAYEVRCLEDAAGAAVIEHWHVPLMGHAWPGGPAGAPHTDPAGPDASRELWRFFAQGAVGC